MQADYFSCVGTVVYLRKENCMYQACPTQDCNKKVVDEQNGLYRCEKCDREFPNFKYRMILSVGPRLFPRLFPGDLPSQEGSGEGLARGTWERALLPWQGGLWFSLEVRQPPPPHGGGWESPLPTTRPGGPRSTSEGGCFQGLCAPSHPRPLGREAEMPKTQGSGSLP